MAEFARVTVVGPEDSAADVSVPLSRPIAEVVDQVSAILDLDPTTEGGWELASVQSGSLPAHGHLAQFGTVDGDVLHIVPAVHAIAAPEVFSAVDVVADHVDSERHMWNGPARHVVVVGYAGLLVVVSAITFGVTGGLVAGFGSAVVGLFMLATFAAAPPASRLVWTTPVCFATAMAAVFHNQSWPLISLAAAGGLLIGVAVTTFVLSPARWAIVASAGISGAGAIACAAAIHFGANATALAAWSAPALLILLTLSGRLAVVWSGLGSVIARTEESAASPTRASKSSPGDGLPRPNRTNIVRRAVVATDIVDGIVWATCSAATAAVVVLAVTGVWEQAALGAYVGLAFLLRSRGFSEVRHVAPIVGVAVTSAFVVPVTLIANRIGDDAAFVSAIATMVVALLLGVVVLFFGFFELPAVTGARVAQLWNALDVLVLLGLVPVLFWAQGIYQYILGTDL